MKHILIIITLSLVSIVALSQEMNDQPDQYLLLTKYINDQPSSQKVNIGDRVKLKLIKSKRVRGKIKNFSDAYIMFDTQQKIRMDSIQWIKKSKPTKGNIVGGSLIMAAGVALLAPVLAGTVDFDAILPQGAAGIGLIILGGFIIAPPKYQLVRKSKITYHEKSNP
jgi:hypothetical protein